MSTRRASCCRRVEDVRLARARRGLLRYLVPHRGPGTRQDGGVSALLDASSDAILGIDDDGICVIANSTAETVFGRARTELVGLGAYRLLPGLATAIDEWTRRRRLGHQPSGPVGPGVAVTALRADGTRFPAAVWLSPVPHETELRDVPVSLYLTVRDLTVPRATAAAHASLRAEVGELRETISSIGRAVRDRAIVILDGDGHILQINRAAEKMLGYRMEEIAGRPCAVLSDHDDLAAVAHQLGTPDGEDPLLEITRSGLPNQQEWNLMARDGSRRPVTLNIVAIGPRQAPTGFIWVATQRAGDWEPLVSARSTADRLLQDLDDAETRTLRWQVGGAGQARRR